MARFKPGQEVVCIEKVWFFQDGNGTFNGHAPKFNEICIVEYYKNNQSMYLVGYNEYNPVGRICYMDDCFEPVVEISELQSILQSEPEFA